MPQCAARPPSCGTCDEAFACAGFSLARTMESRHNVIYFLVPGGVTKESARMVDSAGDFLSRARAKGLLLLLTVIIGGCGSSSSAHDSAAGTSGEFEGWAQTGSEHRWFQRCGQGERWWWNIDRLQTGRTGIGNYEKWVAASRSSCGDATDCMVRSAYLKVVGVVSPSGAYGHLRRYPREIDILTIEDAAPQRPSSCALP